MRVAAILLAALLLAGCGSRAADCGAAASIEAVAPLVQQRLTDRTRSRVQAFGGPGSAAPIARVRAAVAELRLAIEDVRTTQSDPNSTRRFCAARLKATLPQQMLQDAEHARQTDNRPDISSLAEAAGVERNADAFTVDIEYAVQPTDDGSRIYAEIENPDSYVNFFSELVTYSLLRSAIERRRRESGQSSAPGPRPELGNDVMMDANAMDMGMDSGAAAQRAIEQANRDIANAQRRATEAMEAAERATR